MKDCTTNGSPEADEGTTPSGACRITCTKIPGFGAHQKLRLQGRRPEGP